MNNIKVVFLIVSLYTFNISGSTAKQLEQDFFTLFTITATFDNAWIEQLNNKLASLQYPTRYQNKSSTFIFETYPALREKLPYISFANLPTPIEKLEALSSKYGATIYIKRDDLTGGFDEQGDHLYGGNKTRKLEFLLAQAQALGATKVMTFGCVGSNHAVATATHAQRLGMLPICMLKDQPASTVVQQNLLLHLYNGSEIHYSANNATRKLASILTWLEHYKKDGQAPYVIPTGGSNEIGTIGYVNAVFELNEQIKKGLMPKPSHIYVPCGSCATTAGILLGCKAIGLDAHIVAVAVEPEEDPTFAQNIAKLFYSTNDYLRSLDSSFPVCSYTEKDLTINLNFTGPDYGIFTQEGTEAYKALRSLEHITLEGTYTAKAFACLLHDVQKNKPQSAILFWNTYCGLDFSKQLRSLEYQKLPLCLQHYFNEDVIQALN